jgi:hypothetical protein
MSDAGRLTPLTVLLPYELFEALQAKLAREDTDASQVAAALFRQYVEESRLEHVRDIMRRYDSTLRTLAK